MLLLRPRLMELRLLDRVEANSLARQMKGVGDGSIEMLQSLAVAAFAELINVLLTNPIWTHKKTSESSANLVLEIVPGEVIQDVVVDPLHYGTMEAKLFLVK
ncbi:peroxisomal nicotinamide adenine dinucleotide carrier-like isoform X4 [Phalaenopsis equestris]|uniref:peroxisomal nicotinamide adenine dinucleotide carrier-like isoform X4 n=1 Tax=Phalaenopsis equestris TaxID=78828 RepID=UPI0009E3242C|nr:peroxisomal nicotinamide adenine dinucleotide carrier-like isoform X4 [Phalaenopsis equestris]XP_020598693.1 peroxisomal nicotinamide adenine dinucleotide carrier-like isoform X4 [Phalaenopsis equestris]